jgi:predicted chitinase
LTRRINGGENGLAHRRELLNKAKGLLSMLSLG